jgi:hypothetical protein
VIALASEMDGPVTIGEISWQRAGSYGSETGYYYGFKLFMGVAADTELTRTFADNYQSGTRTLVYSTTA